MTTHTLLWIVGIVTFAVALIAASALAMAVYWALGGEAWEDE